MDIISARHFRDNQTALLNKALRGESVLITSRVGTFKIVPVDSDDRLTSRVCQGLNEVKLMRKGQLKGYSISELINEL